MVAPAFNFDPSSPSTGAKATGCTWSNSFFTAKPMGLLKALPHSSGNDCAVPLANVVHWPCAVFASTMATGCGIIPEGSNTGCGDNRWYWNMGGNGILVTRSRTLL